MASASLTHHPLCSNLYPFTVYYHCLEVASHCFHHYSRNVCHKKNGLQFATTHTPHCSIALFSDSLSALQIIKFHRPHSHHNLTLTIHYFILHWTSLGHNICLQWVPSHVSVMGNTVANRAAVRACARPSPIDLATNRTDILTDLKTACR